MDLDLDLFDRHDRKDRRRRSWHDDDEQERPRWRDDDEDDRVGRGDARRRDDERQVGRRDDDRRRRRDDGDAARRHRRDEEDDDRDDGWRRAMHRGRRHAPRWPWHGHRHVFAWLVLGGGVVLLAMLAIGVASALGLWGPIADGYVALSKAVLPTSWHDEWQALPGVVHVAMALGALFVAAGIAGEVLD